VSAKAVGWVAGIAASVIAAAIIAYLNIGATPPGATITGPSTVVYGSGFSLYGHVNGSFSSAYWTDTFGRDAPFAQDAPTPFICPGVGQYTVTLTEVSSGNDVQATHTISCVP
jgi:hypothetical protein